MVNLFQGFEKKLFGLWRSFSGSCLFNEHHKGCCVLESGNTYENLAQSLKKSLKVLRFGLWEGFCGFEAFNSLVVHHSVL